MFFYGNGNRQEDKLNFKVDFKPILTSHMQTFHWTKKVNDEDQWKGVDKYNPSIHHKAMIRT